MTILSGTFPVVATPFRDDGAIEEQDFRSLLDFIVTCGADGCVFPGVASEVETLSAAERGGLVALLGGHLRARIPFIVGASGPDPESVLARIREGAAAGAAAAMVMAPARLGPDVSAHIAFFSEIGKAAQVPILLQNAPAPIGAGLSPEAVAEIAHAVDAVEYVKEETLPCGQNLSRIRAAAGAAIRGVFGGAGARYVTDELARGALGTMPASELADVHVDLVRAFGRGEEAAARRLYAASLPLLTFQAVFRMAMTKEVLRRRGVIRHVFVRAGGPKLDDGDRRELALLLEEAADLPRIRPWTVPSQVA